MKVNSKTVKWFYHKNGTETQCEVRTNGETVLATGMATKYAKDKIDKRMGRYVSFKKAMTQAKQNETLTKSEREELWTKFRNEVKQPIKN